MIRECLEIERLIAVTALFMIFYHILNCVINDGKYYIMNDSKLVQMLLVKVKQK